jgi:hypothetical protein
MLQTVVGVATNDARRCYQHDLVFRIFTTAYRDMLHTYFFLLQLIRGFAKMVQNYCYGVSYNRL